MFTDSKLNFTNTAIPQRGNSLSDLSRSAGEVARAIHQRGKFFFILKKNCNIPQEDIYSHKKNKTERKGQLYTIMNRKKHICDFIKFFYRFICCVPNKNNTDISEDNNKKWEWPLKGKDRFRLDSDISESDYETNASLVKKKFSEMKLPLMTNESNIWIQNSTGILHDEEILQGGITQRGIHSYDIYEDNCNEYCSDDFYTPSNSKILDPSDIKYTSLINSPGDISGSSGEVAEGITPLGYSQDNSQIEDRNINLYDSDSSTESLVRYFTTVYNKINTENN